MRVTEELTLFTAKRREWSVDHEGEYAVIDGQSLIGFFGDMEKAFAAGFKVAKRTDFFMGRVTPEPEVVFNPTFFVCP